jgi:D-aminopeptidase
MARKNSIRLRRQRHEKKLQRAIGQEILMSKAREKRKLKEEIKMIDDETEQAIQQGKRIIPESKKRTIERRVEIEKSWLAKKGMMLVPATSTTMTDSGGNQQQQQHTMEIIDDRPNTKRHKIG